MKYERLAVLFAWLWVPAASSAGLSSPPANEAVSQTLGAAQPALLETAVDYSSSAARPHPAPMLLAQAPRVAAPATAAEPPVSAAEQVTRLRRAIEEDEQHLRDVKAEQDDLTRAYTAAESAFEKADAAVEAQKKAMKSLVVGDRKARATAEAELNRLEKVRGLVKDRFDLAIEDRKISAQQLETLEQKLRRDRRALDRAEGREPAKPDAAAGDAGDGAPTSDAAPLPAASAGTPSAPATPVAAATATASAPVKPAGTPAPAPGKDKPPVDRELLKAEQDAKAKMAASKAADAEAKSATERLDSLDKEINLERTLLANARKQRDNSAEMHSALNDVFRARSLAGAPKAELDKLVAQLGRVEQRLATANKEVNEHTVHLEELQTERASLQGEQLDALRKAKEAHENVKQAENDIKRLENPFNPHNILRWLIEHGPKIVLVLLAMLVGHWMSKKFSQRVISLVARSSARGSSVEREARARTLIGVFHNAASLVIIIGGGLMILQEAGIPIAPLLGGAAVFGLAVAFGAQNLIRDYFYGFIILLENQYKLNDVVQIGSLSGQVENITLRMTVLRDLEGQVHFLPNGEIKAVTNMTHGWSRALFAIGVAYKENVDRVIAVLLALANDLRNDPAFSAMILEDATMLGVDSLDDSAVVIKFFIKTRPLKQWDVKRELLRRIKNRFDELGIEIPFPQRTVYHRVESDFKLPEPFSASNRAPHGNRSVRADS